MPPVLLGDVVPVPPDDEAPPGDAAALGDISGGDDKDMALLPYDAGRLQVDEAIDGTWWVTDVLTKESKQVPPDIVMPELLFTVDRDRAVLMCAASDEAAAVDEMMAKKVYLHKGMRIMQEVRKNGEAQFEFEDYWSRHREATLNIPFSSFSADLTFQIAVFVRERGVGCRVYWSMSNLYKLMKLDSYKKVPSKWVYNSVDSWGKMLKVCGCDHIIHSQLKQRDEVTVQQKCLAATSASSVGLVALLAIFGGRGGPIWRTAGPRAAGMRKGCAQLIGRSRVLQREGRRGHLLGVQRAVGTRMAST